MYAATGSCVVHFQKPSTQSGMVYPVERSHRQVRRRREAGGSKWTSCEQNVVDTTWTQTVEGQSARRLFRVSF